MCRLSPPSVARETQVAAKHRVTLGHHMHTPRAFALLTGLILATAANADVILSDGNSVAKIDPASSNGMYYWGVQGQNQLSQQWFWYRAGAMTAESPINTLGAPSIALGSGPT